jgi:quercetin 2,3-dioxygenase
VTIDIRQPGDRARTDQPGFVTWHCFSAGSHYDPDNLGFGSLIGHDEHLLAGGAGFPRHAHRDVDIVSWILDGRLRHNGVTIGVGTLLHQRTGAGVEHLEANASADQPLRLVQMTLLSPDGAQPPAERVVHVAADGHRGAGPVLELAGAALSVVRLTRRAPIRVSLPGRGHLFVTRGALSVGHRRLPAGAAGRLVDETDVSLGTETNAEALLWRLSAPLPRTPGGAPRGS